jgi:hypothetical protein
VRRCKLISSFSHSGDEVAQVQNEKRHEIEPHGDVQPSIEQVNHAHYLVVPLPVAEFDFEWLVLYF